MLGRVEISAEALEVLQPAGENIDRNVEPMAHMIAMEIGIDLLMRILSATGTAESHLEVDTIEVRDGEQGDGIYIHEWPGCQTCSELGGGNVVSLKARHDLVVSRRFLSASLVPNGL